MATVTLNLTLFRQQFVEFANTTTYPDARLEMYFTMGTCYVSDNGNSQIGDDVFTVNSTCGHGTYCPLKRHDCQRDSEPDYFSFSELQRGNRCRSSSAYQSKIMELVVESNPVWYASGSVIKTGFGGGILYRRQF